ncbi:MAG TPA: hypothetical protein VKB71_10040, partial [Rhizomicrobium sp.]|nr:hypothetical protein [Rhizomicrobium sp.]
GYLEASDGPILLRDVEWIEVSTRRIKGGVAKRPRQMVDVKHEILTGLKEMQLHWELRESRWTVEGVLEEEPVQVVRVVKPLGPTPSP